MQESEVNSDNYFHPIVTGNEIWVLYYDPLSEEVKVWKKSDKEAPIRLRRTSPVEKITTIIFWDKHGILPDGTTIGVLYYASVIEQVCCTILEKCGGKAGDEVLFLHDNAFIDKCNIAQTAIRKADFIELNHLSYSPDTAPSDFYVFSNFFVRRISVAMMKKSILLRTI